MNVVLAQLDPLHCVCCRTANEALLAASPELG